MRYSNFLSTASNRASLSITQTLYDRRALDCTSSRPLVSSLQQLMILTSSSGRVRETLCADGGLERIVQIMKDCAGGECDADVEAYKWHLGLQCLLNLGARGSEYVRKRILEAGAMPLIATVLDNYLVAHGDSLEHRDRDRDSRVHTHRHAPPSLATAATGSTANTGYSVATAGNAPSYAASASSSARPLVANSGDMMADNGLAARQGTLGSSDSAERRSSADASGFGGSGGAGGPGAAAAPASGPAAAPAAAPRPASATSVVSSMGREPDAAGAQEPATAVASLSDGDAVGDGVGDTEDMRMAMRTGLFLTQFTQATGRAVNGLSREQQGEQTLRLPSAMRETADIETVGTRLPQFMNGILVPHEQGVCWALEIIAFVSKYSHLRREMHETHLLPKLSLRPHEDLFTCVYESDCSDMSSHSSMEECMDVDEYSSPHSSQSSLGRGQTSSGSSSLSELTSAHTKPRDYEAMYYAYDFENTVDFDEEYLTKRINLFELVERFTAFRWPSEFPHWACIIMRNVVRKDESKGGIRQCAHFSCGKWETSPRQFAKCRRCKRTKYCSKACQLKSWSMHRYWCTPANTGSSTSQSQQSDRQAPDAATNSPRAGAQGSATSLQSLRHDQPGAAPQQSLNPQHPHHFQHPQQQPQLHAPGAAPPTQAQPQASAPLQLPRQAQQPQLQLGRVHPPAQQPQPQPLVFNTPLGGPPPGGILGAPLQNAFHGQHPLQPFAPVQPVTAPVVADGQASRAESELDGPASPGTRQNSSVMLADP